MKKFESYFVLLLQDFFGFSKSLAKMWTYTLIVSFYKKWSRILVETELNFKFNFENIAVLTVLISLMQEIFI